MQVSKHERQNLGQWDTMISSVVSSLAQAGSGITQAVLARNIQREQIASQERAQARQTNIAERERQLQLLEDEVKRSQSILNSPLSTRRDVVKPVYDTVTGKVIGQKVSMPNYTPYLIGGGLLLVLLLRR